MRGEDDRLGEMILLVMLFEPEFTKEIAEMCS